MYKRQTQTKPENITIAIDRQGNIYWKESRVPDNQVLADPVSYTHLRAHETVLDIVCRLLLEKKNSHIQPITSNIPIN